MIPGARPIGRCSWCQKDDYPSRKAAKAAGNRLARREGRQAERGPIRGYPCPRDPRRYHWGHASKLRITTVEENRRGQVGLIRAIGDAALNRDRGNAS